VRAVLLGLAVAMVAVSARAVPAELARQRAEAAQVRIVRDDWGIAHVHGHTDAQAVFGMAYAQAEDDFSRVEANYIDALGRRAEADGEAAIWQDLRMRLIVDPVRLKADYAASPAWLRSLMRGWADGLNYYLATHPDVRPKVIRHFEPWMALSFSEGSIGPDIERADLPRLKGFYDGATSADLAPLPERAADGRILEAGGSNGIAIAPSNTQGGHALLLINPHTSFFFRSELQMTSDQGLNAYGAVTWGQFFIYQGFNAHAGWMHTSTGADVVDEFAETIVKKAGKLFYRYGSELRPVGRRSVVIAYKVPGGAALKRFTVYSTHHGPIVRADGGKWIALALMQKPVPALEQSFLRTKTRNLAGFLKVAELKANSSNNTLFADDHGETAYLHPQFVPRRNDRFDYTRPVDGADPATDWQGPTPLAELPAVVTPKTGWTFNSNDEPWNAAGVDSPKKASFPRYMDQAGENMRGVHAARLLSARRDFTREGLMRAAYDPWLPGFAILIPSLLAAYDATPASDPLKARLADQVALLRAWDERWGVESVATSLAVFWGDELWKSVPASRAVRVDSFNEVVQRVSAHDKLAALAAASDRLTADFGSWRTPWGEINRFQRIDDAIAPRHDDAAPSIPVGFTSATWGSLAAFGAQRYPGTRRLYGYKGNSFVAVVEFGPKVRALAVTAGGESGHPGDKHFDDQAARYASGNLREVYFWPEQLKGHVERSYRPGE
jgi:acyl-homoserine-lactone acylase